MTRSGVNNNNNYSWVADSDGYTYYTLLTNTQVSRPTFYLEDNVKWIEGTGTSSDPYLIE